MSYGATPDDWFNLDLLGLTTDLLPVVSNPHSPISPNSKLKQLGKVPSRYNGQRQIAGIADWTNYKATAKDIEKWSKEPDCGICIQTRNVRALDIDVADEELARALKDFIFNILRGFSMRRTPIRARRNSNKILFPFTLKGEFPKRVMKVDGGIIEFLANGQQFVAIGTHPSGARYEGLENISEFPEITIEQFNELWTKLTNVFALEPPSQASLRNLSADPSQGVLAAIRDPVVAYLEEHGHVTGLGREGQIFLRCPFNHEHSEPDKEDGTSTAYLPAGHRDYELGHFSCLHAHCASRDDAAFLDAVGYRLADFEALPPEPAPEGVKTKFAPISAALFAQRPPVAWLMKGLLPQYGFYQFYGPSGASKTFVVLDMMLALCRGAEWNSHKIKRKHKVIYICAEGAGGFVSRLKAYAKHHAIDFKGIDFAVIPETPNFRDIKDIKLVADQVNSLGPVDVIIVDTLAQVSPGADENTAKDMSVILRHCDELRKLTNAACGLVHHAGKDVNKGSRGWSGIKGPLDAQFLITKNEDDNTHTFWVDKMKDDRDGYGYNFTLETVNFGLDDDGDIISSCVPVFAGATSSKKKKKIIGYKGWKKEAMQAFEELGGTKEHITAVITLAMRNTPHDDTRKDRRRELLLRAIRELADDGEWVLANNIIARDLKV